MALTASDDGTVVVRDILQSSPSFGKSLHIFSGHRGRVFDAQFTPGSSHVLTGGEDRTVLMWRMDSLDNLIDWACENRHVPRFTYFERWLYNIDNDTPNPCENPVIVAEE
jgi:WD40 repeat protein